MHDTYRTLASSGEAIYTEKRSKFLAFAHHVSSEEEAKSIVQSIKKKYYDARHVCYAYALGFNGEHTRSNDDGEPSGSAGKPILGQLRSADVTFTLVAVVRYFGGVKLGTGGLAVAYKTAAAEALSAAIIEERIMEEDFTVSVPYADADVAMRFIREGGGNIIERNYTETDNLLTIRIRQAGLEDLRERLKKILSLKFIDKTKKEDE